jgi:hypothetical protein
MFSSKFGNTEHRAMARAMGYYFRLELIRLGSILFKVLIKNFRKRSFSKKCKESY